MASSPTDREPDESGPPTEVVGSAPLPAQEAQDPAQQLAACLAADMAEAWRRGERVRAEDYLQKHPLLAKNRDAAFRIICEEVCLRQEAGLTLDFASFEGRFPHWRKELHDFLACQRLMESGFETSVDMSSSGLEDFEHLVELGEGAQGRVYLARQRSLNDRPMVLKVTSCRGQEHLSLA